jgi:hypothetical protein
MKVNHTKRQTSGTDGSERMPFNGKPVKPPANQGRAGEPFTQAELATWVQKAKDLPDIRWDRVQAMREAIRSEGFDLDVRLSKIGEKLPAELLEYFRQAGGD